MTSITVYDGTNTIGGNKIYIEENGKGIFLDFGMNFKKYDVYFQEFLSSRNNRGIHDLDQLNLIPKLDIYRKDVIPKDLDISQYPKLNVEAILLSHAHMDHFGNIGLLKPEYPIICSPTTLMLLKGIVDSSSPMLGSDVAYYSLRIPKNDDRILETDRTKDIGRDFVLTKSFSDKLTEFMATSVKSKKKLEQGQVSHLKDFNSTFEINSYDVDHSIFGATAFMVTGEITIAYTGDFRLHGSRGKKSEKFIQNAKNASILIIEGTRAAKEDISESEDIVYENCRRTAELAKGLIVADFSARNFERLETFRKIANGIGRSFVITPKDAYLLSALEKADGVNRTDNLLMFGDLRSNKRNWEDVYLKGESDIPYVDPKEISRDPENFLICFSLFDIKNLLDIKPSEGTYIYSSSEAFEEESEFDFVRLNNWLNHFNFKVYGFEVVDKDGKVKPKFTKGFHASGHASRKDLIWAIETINPDTVIPVHTNNPNWFKENIDNAVVMKNGETYKI
ncbi:MAG: MBL fold metallo-hydrolase RNA specificity domain-containing protein [Promethearchaeota archaeon]|jgi:ribonuclease J